MGYASRVVVDLGERARSVKATGGRRASALSRNRIGGCARCWCECAAR